MKKLTDFIINKRYFILIIFIMFSIISVFLYNKVNVNYDISRYLSNDSETKIGIDIANQEFSDIQELNIEVNKNEKLSILILVVSILLAILILLVMCESYIEPFIFLLVIGIAVILNNSTNLILGSISNITNSIITILQILISLEYSIIIMNRFRQEKETELNRVNAMKNALYNSYKSILSNAFTTIISLVLLVFMSFTIGKDFGLALAKGILLSLITVSCLLPTLILIFHKTIIRTKRKKINIKIERVGNLSVKFRYLLTLLFLTIFLGSYLLKGNLKISYMDSEINGNEEKLNTNNQIIVIYNNEEETKIDEFITKIEKNEKVDEVLAYSNTINEKLNYNELNNKINNLGANINIEDDLLKILYYRYNNANIENTITFRELYDFMQMEIYNNETMSKMLDNEMQANINQIKYFTQNEEINKRRNITELTSILGMNKINVRNILNYYNSKNSNIELTVNEFVNFIEKDVLTNSKYSHNVDENMKLKIKQITKEIDNADKKMTSNQMAELFGTNKKNMETLYGIYSSKYIEKNQTISLKNFMQFTVNDVMKNREYSSYFDTDTKIRLQNINSIIQDSLIDKKYNVDECFSILNRLDERLDKNAIELIYMYYGSKNEYNDEWKLTIEEFARFLNENILNDSKFNEIIVEDMKISISNTREIIQDVKKLIVGEKYSRIIICTSLEGESDETFKFIQSIKENLKANLNETYVIGDLAMAYEVSRSFESEFSYVSILIMVAMFVIIAIASRSVIIPIILICINKCSIYIITGILSCLGGEINFIVLIIVYSILMGLTIDYAIIYTSYYLENRKKLELKEAIKETNSKSMHTIITSALVLIIVTFIVGILEMKTISRIYMILAGGALVSVILTLILLPGLFATFDKIITRKID